MLQFRKATRERARARVALIGPAGSGKTMSALAIAEGLGQRIAVIDTEHGSASKYAGPFQFDVLELESFAPDTYVEAIRAAAKGDYDVLIIDSLSHAWMGKDGALEQVDLAAARSRSGNTFAAWRQVTPQHNRLVEAMLACPMHLIVTMRSKTEYVLVDVEKDGKTIKEPRKIGMAPIQRDGLEYEFDVVGDLTLEHDYVVSKTRCSSFDRAVVHEPGVAFAADLRAWLETGEAPTRAPAMPPAEQRAAPTGRQARSRRDTEPPRERGRDSRDPRERQLRAAIQGSAPAPATAGRQAGDLPAEACFSPRASWLRAAEWNGKPLSAAPLPVLLEYRSAVDVAIADPKNKNRYRVLSVHRDNVQQAIDALGKSAERAGADQPELEREPGCDDAGAEGDEGGLHESQTGWDLSGEGGAIDDEPESATH